MAKTLRTSIETDVLVVGSGPAGGTAAALPGMYGVSLAGSHSSVIGIKYIANKLRGSSEKRGPEMRKRRTDNAVRALCLAVAIGAPASSLASAAVAQEIERGKYLVALGGCFDCHTPGYFLGKPDMTRYLGGSEVGFEIPGLGVFYGPNLTPDKETGLGNWTSDQIVLAIRTGRRPDGRILAPAMPWRQLSQLSDSDAAAIAAYLKSLPSVSNRVPGPFGPSEKPTSFVMKVVPPDNGAPPK
jgi:mono/diheme cytochrome c family protein